MHVSRWKKRRKARMGGVKVEKSGQTVPRTPPQERGSRSPRCWALGKALPERKNSINLGGGGRGYKKLASWRENTKAPGTNKQGNHRFTGKNRTRIHCGKDRCKGEAENSGTLPKTSSAIRCQLCPQCPAGAKGVTERKNRGLREIHNLRGGGLD